MKIERKKISLPKIIGKGYATFWNFKGRYRVVKGSRASKKSKTTALWFIYKMMEHPDANSLVIRKTYRTLKDSCFSDLKWATRRLHCEHLWEFKESPLEAIYKPTGQKILFRGLDDPLKVTSVSVDKGCLCWLWIEEGYEINSESDFDTIDESIRGVVPDGLFKQITITFNPWNDRHWLKRRFFDECVGTDSEGNKVYKERSSKISDDGQILAITTNYKINEWLDKADEKLFERMKKHNPQRYKVAGLGQWGIVDGLVFDNWKEQKFQFVRKKDFKDSKTEVVIDDLKPIFGLDFGYTNDPTALFCGMIDLKNFKIYVFDELYKKGLKNKDIYEEINNLGYVKEKITADSSEPKSIDELKSLGLRVEGAKKGKDSINNGIQYIKNFEIIIHPRCVNFITEIQNYTWKKDKFGKATNVPIDDFNHLMDAMRYGSEKYIIEKKGWLF